jgi:hypothetical protein
MYLKEKEIANHFPAAEMKSWSAGVPGQGFTNRRSGTPSTSMFQAFTF